MSDATQLASYACSASQTRGRVHAESAPQTRSEYQRDRDRILHSAAFRRLEYKTQVFVNHEGDLFRTRLTHSLEVAQIGRSIARNLGLNEDLVEAIALAHDLGHTPFGHAGQDALNQCMQAFGGFEHNLQSLRVVDTLEESYAAFDGLNLTFETREGILKHCSVANAAMLGEIGQRFIDRTQASLEAQLSNLADEIAYNNHDVDDGLRSGLLSIEQLLTVPLFADQWQDVQRSYPGLSGRRAIHETIRRMINVLVSDLIEQSRRLIGQHAPANVEEVRRAGPLIGFSAEMQQQANVLKRFLRENLYRHYQVQRTTSKAKRIVRELFQAFIEEPSLLAPAYRAEPGDVQAQARCVADYIAGMTDRHAMRQYRRLFVVDEL